MSVQNSKQALGESIKNDLKEQSIIHGDEIDNFIKQRESEIKILSQADVLEGDLLNQVESVFSDDMT